jgi:membrane associated rhomboid family serine protease
MNEFFKQLWANLRTGTIVLVSVLLALFLIKAFGQMTKQYDLAAWLALNPATFWKGRIWTIVTHAFLPASIVDIVLTGLMIAMLGTWIERFWSKTDLWLYCLVVAAGTGVVHLLVGLLAPSITYGTLPLAFGMLVAVTKLCGHERVTLAGGVTMTVRTFAYIILALDFIFILLTTGFAILGCLAAASAWGVGWLYLTCYWKYQMSGPSQKVESKRIRRLEL